MELKQSIINLIQDFIEKKISLRKITSELLKEKDYLLNLDKTKSSFTEIAFCLYFSIENTNCPECNKQMKFSGLEKGYVCSKKCRHLIERKKLSKEECIKKIQEIYFSEKSKKSIIGTIKSLIKLFWEKESKENFSKTLYDIVFDIKELPKCKICGADANFHTKKFEYSNGCSISCSTKYQMLVLTPWTEESKSKMVKKIKETKLKKYGSETYNNSEKHKESRLKNNDGKWFSELSLRKKEETTLSKYGVKNVSQSDIIKLKVEETTLKNYGIKRFPNISKEKVRKVNEEKGRWIPLDSLSDYKYYLRLVKIITNSQDISGLENLDKRGMSSLDESFHLDHKFSIFQGFTENILPIYIGSIQNLKMLESKTNISKGRSCSITKEELFNNFRS